MSIKDQVLANAMKAMQSEAAQNLMQNEKFQKTMASVFRTTFKVRNGMAEAKKRLAKKMNFATQEEMRDLQRSIDRLERRLRRSEKKEAAAKEAAVQEAAAEETAAE